MTLTYVYADQTAVLGPLSTAAEPHAYDLCEQHSERLSAPRGWEVLRLAAAPTASGPSDDDLLALADAVREAAVRPSSASSGGPARVVEGRPRERYEGDPTEPPVRPGPGGQRPRGGHLRVLTTDPG